MLEEKRNEFEEFDGFEVEDDVEGNEVFDLSNARSTKSKNNSKTIGKSGGVSIVNASCGHRVTLGNQVCTWLGFTNEVQMLMQEKHLVIGKGLAKQNEKYTVRPDGRKKLRGHIYNRALVKEITEAYGLDFSSRTSITFSDVKYYEQDGASFVAVKIIG